MATINGTAQDDTLTGTQLADIINGLNGNDTINGGAGGDTMNGGHGDDIYIVDDAADVVTEGVNEGQDLVQTTLAAYTMPTNVEWLWYTGTGAFHGIGNAAFNWIRGGNGNDLLDGGTGNDSLEGGAGNDTYIVDHEYEHIVEEENGGVDTVKTGIAQYQLYVGLENLIYTGPAGVRFTGTGNDLDNRIEGGSGNDVLDGGWGGIDTLIGFGGNDYYFVRDAGDIVVEEANGGTDDVLAYSSSYTLPANVEKLFAATTANFTGIGNALNNEIAGNAGNDVLNGMGGADVMWGNAGNDTYHVDHVDDRVEESENNGTDRVITTVSNYYLRWNVEELVYAGDPSVDAQLGGNALNNYLKGSAGNDTLYGDAGDDKMEGGAGNDTYWIDSSGDEVIEAASGGGKDFAWVGATFYQMGAGLEDATTFGAGNFDIRGNALANRIETNNGNDVIRGGAGADLMIGWGGDDVYYVDDAGDVVEEQADRGKDGVCAQVASYTLGDNVEDLVNVNDNSVDFYGRGNALANHLVGGNGRDTLDGAGGADMMFGHKGDDIYYVDNENDHVGENEGNGTDEVRVANLGAYTLGANFERLVFEGTANFQAFGNGLANSLVTGAGNDFLNGGAGADRMEGKGGNDAYVVDDAGDVVVEAANGGVDSVWTTLSAYTLAANVETLLYGGAYGTAFTATGNDLANVIETGEGADYIDGGAGADQMTGRNGNDVYIVDNAGDTVVEWFFGGTDEVRTALGSRSNAAAMYILPENVENLTGTSAAGQGVFANALNNVVKMGAGGDLIVMQDGGDDRVEAGAGDDYVYWGGSFSSDDSMDGGAGFDTVGLTGNYSLNFDADDLVNVEKLAVYSSGGHIPNIYDLATVDANVGAGKTLMVVGLSLSAEEKLTFNGSAETDGRFNIRGGKGDDGLAGGAQADLIYGNKGADTLWGGAGADQFEYKAVTESTHNARDRILDFTAGDKINLKAIDADNNAANGNSKFAFIGGESFGGVAGQLRAVDLGGQWLVEGDTNGDAIADLSILVTTTSAAHIIGAADFYL